MRDEGQTPVARAPMRSGCLGRLTKRPQFLAAATGRRFHTERVSVQGLYRADELGQGGGPDGLRIGLTVTKRVGHATERNRIRRRLRAAIHQAAGPFAELPADVVLVGRRQALSAGFAELVADLARAVPAVARPGSAGVRPGQKGPRRGKGSGPASGPTRDRQRHANPPHETDPASSRP